jgi:hypothetical protein
MYENSWLQATENKLLTFPKEAQVPQRFAAASTFPLLGGRCSQHALSSTSPEARCALPANTMAPGPSTRYSHGWVYEQVVSIAGVYSPSLTSSWWCLAGMCGGSVTKTATLPREKVAH